MSMPTEQRCVKCGAELSVFTIEGCCSACLLERGLLDEPIAVPPQKARFGDYELIEEIARGGMGVVYKARQVGLDRLVAIKMILNGHFASAGEIQRFRSEARAAAKLQHPGIVSIHEVAEHDGLLFFSMDLVQGKNLAQLVRDGPWGAMKAAQCVRDVAEAIQYAHEQGVLHRDIKPSNVLIDQNGRPRVTDFGLAKHLSTPDLATQSVVLTVSGQVLGSPNFMPPEQAVGKNREVTPASDVYSLGALLYHLLTGRPPFLADNVAATLRLVSETEPVAPRLLLPTVPRDLETICLRCIEKEPGRRYQTAEELSLELGRFLRGEPIHARRMSGVEKTWRWCRRNPRVLAAFSAIALLGAAAVAGLFYAKNREHVASYERRKTSQILRSSDQFLAERAINETNLAYAGDILKGLQDAIHRQPDNPRLWTARAVTLEKTASLEEAHQHFSRAIALATNEVLGPVLTDALLRRRDLLKRMNRMLEARVDDYRARQLAEPRELVTHPLREYASADQVSLRLGVTNLESGLYATRGKDSRSIPGVFFGADVWCFPAGWNYGFFLDPMFKWSLDSDVIIRVECRGASISVHFDGLDGAHTDAHRIGSSRDNSGWRTDEFELHDVKFDNSQNGGADFRLWSTESDAYVRRISVARVVSNPRKLVPLTVPDDLRDNPIFIVSATNVVLQGGATLITNRGRIIFRFEGEEFGVPVPDSRSQIPQTEITIVFWQKVPAVRNQASLGLAEYDITRSLRCIAVYSDGRIYFDFGNNRAGGSLSYRPKATILGTWQHFAFVASQEGNFMQIYRNGVLEAQQSRMTPFYSPPFDLVIGQGFSGLLSEVSIFERAVPASQIRSIYESERSKFRD
jgi:serine/threonine protein kinase